LLDKNKPVSWKVYHAAWIALDWFFPPICAGCGKSGRRFCDSCLQKVSQINGYKCPICGASIAKPGNFPHCKSQKIFYQSLQSWAYYQDPLRKSIHRLKYKHDIVLGDYFSTFLIKKLSELQWQFDIIAPVPLNIDRYLERDYNQADILAYPVALALQKKYIPHLLQRNRNTPSQVGKSRLEREMNVYGAFNVNLEKIPGKSILLIDDVVTTGSTINECARVLMDAGAKSVYGLTLAKASNFTQNMLL